MNSPEKTDPKNAPIFNLPIATKTLAMIIIGVFFVQFFMYPTGKANFFASFGFVPSNFLDFPPKTIFAIISPFSYIFIHGTLLHVIMNTLMVVAFGSGVERWLGTKKFLILFFGTAIAAITIHFFYAVISDRLFETYYLGRAIIGASGATSGLFAAGIIYLRNIGTGIGSGPNGLAPLVILFIFISIIFGLTGSPDGHSVAWVAHIGGFLSGFAFLKFMKKL